MGTFFEQMIVRDFIRPKSREKVMAMSERKKRWFSDISKEENVGGKDFATPADIHSPGGWARTRTGAQRYISGTSGNGVYGQWINTPGTISGGILFSDREIAASEGMTDNAFASFYEARKHRIAGLFERFAGIVSRLCLGPPGGTLAQVASISSGVITLNSNYSERIADLQKGDILVYSQNDGSTSTDTTLGSGSRGYVIAVNLSGDSPTVTVSASDGGSAGSPTGWEAVQTGYIFREEEFQGGLDQGPNVDVETHKLVIDSFQAWVPSAVKTNTFKNVDRSQTSALCGVIRTSSDIVGNDISECLEDLAEEGQSRHGWDLESQRFYMHPRRVKQLSRNLEARKIRTESVTEARGGESVASWGYSKMKVHSADATYIVVPDAHCDQTVAVAMDPDDWVFRSEGGFPGLMDRDSNQILRQATEDNLELRAKSYPSFMLKSGRNINRSGRTALPAES